MFNDFVGPSIKFIIQIEVEILEWRDRDLDWSRHDFRYFYWWWGYWWINMIFFDLVDLGYWWVCKFFIGKMVHWRLGFYVGNWFVFNFVVAFVDLYQNCWWNWLILMWVNMCLYCFNLYIFRWDFGWEFVDFIC